jgi:hypothetical protein
MDALREQLNKPLVVGIASFIVGLIIGLVVLGWWLWPVEWTDAAPEHLRTEFKEVYLRMAIDSYTLNPEPVPAQQRIEEVGEESAEILADIQANPGSQDPDSIEVFVAISAGEEVGVVPEEPAAPAEEEEGGLSAAALVILCIVGVILVAGLVLAFLFRDRIRGLVTSDKPEELEAVEEDYVDYAPPGEEPPIAQFMTTYNLGNDLYDDSFSIDSQSGEFLGECGVGISETVGVGEPKRVTAFEVWLFDKNDIQTVTQVLMSDHAFLDEETKQRLEAKGEPVLAEPGRELFLETATLRLVTRVVDMTYGTGAAPDESFFDRMTLELVVWSKA